MKPNELSFGLNSKTIHSIHAVFKQHPEVQKAVLYGSRAKGNYKNGSDIDLTLIGTALNYRLLQQISLEQDDLCIPYHLDLSILAEITNPDLLDPIQRIGVTFYEK